MMAMIDAYSTQRMHNDLELLATDEKWWTKEKKNVPSWAEFDAARRNVHFYYKKAYQLWKADLIDDEFMRDWVANTNGYPRFFSSVLPASKKKDMTQDMSRFVWADELKRKFPPYQGQPEKPLTAPYSAFSNPGLELQIGAALLNGEHWMRLGRI